MIDRQEFGSFFKIGDEVRTGGGRTRFVIENIGADDVSVRPKDSKNRALHPLAYEKIDAVIKAFPQIDPKRIEPTFHQALKAYGIRDHTNEVYLYGLVRELLERQGSNPSTEEPLPEEIPEKIAKLLLEGAKKAVTVNLYERDLTAKRRCIKRWGFSCVVCSFNFANRYGAYGEGFIHVHHLKPLAEIGREYELDPERDLRPVCPNCHAMLYHSNPVLSIEELQAKVR